MDYPRTFQEFEAWFPDEQACHRYLCRLRWPQGFVCPSCKAPTSAWMTGRGLLHCPQCQAQSSVTAGTLLQGTRKPLRTWLLTLWFVTSQRLGASALGLQRVLGLGSYQTAWSWLHKLSARTGRFGPRIPDAVDREFRAEWTADSGASDLGSTVTAVRRHGSSAAGALQGALRPSLNEAGVLVIV